MTFEEWQAKRSPLHILSEEEAGAYAGETGYVYEAGFLCLIDNLYVVPLPQEERSFATLDTAERFLWVEWCGPEINAD